MNMTSYLMTIMLIIFNDIYRLQDTNSHNVRDADLELQNEPKSIINMTIESLTR